MAARGFQLYSSLLNCVMLCAVGYNRIAGQAIGYFVLTTYQSSSDRPIGNALHQWRRQYVERGVTECVFTK